MMEGRKLPKRMNRHRKNHNPGNLRYPNKRKQSQDEWGWRYFEMTQDGEHTRSDCIRPVTGYDGQAIVAQVRSRVENNTSAYLHCHEAYEIEPMTIGKLVEIALAGVIAVYEGYCAKDLC